MQRLVLEGLHKGPLYFQPAGGGRQTQFEGEEEKLIGGG